MTGPFGTQLDAGEILVGLRIPALSGAGTVVVLQVLPQARRVRRSDRGDAARRGVRRLPGGDRRDQRAPHVIEDARFAAERYDPEQARAALEAAGVADDPYEMQIHHAALKRAAAQLALA